MVYGFFIWILEFIFDFCYLKIQMYFYKYPKNRDGTSIHHVFEITNWNTRNVIHHGFWDTFCILLDEDIN